MKERKGERKNERKRRRECPADKLCDMEQNTFQYQIDPYIQYQLINLAPDMYGRIDFRGGGCGDILLGTGLYKAPRDNFNCY